MFFKERENFSKGAVNKDLFFAVCSKDYTRFDFTINFRRSKTVNKLEGNWLPDRIWALLGRVYYFLLNIGPVACN